MLPRDPSRTRPPTDRPLDIVGLEVLLAVSQALLAGILLSMAADLGADARAVGLPVPGLVALLAIGVGVAWFWWLAGGSGVVLAGIDLAVALLAGSLWLLSLMDAGAPRVDPFVGLVGLLCALYGIVVGLFLPGPRRRHWKDGESRPRRGLPETRSTPARFSPPVQQVVDERLTQIRLPKVNLPKRGSPAAGAVTAPPLDAVAPAAEPGDPDEPSEPDDDTLPVPTSESTGSIEAPADPGEPDVPEGS